ncbi:AAA family ATPase [archaeon]|nr:MAG: AAA family ATPase [archaeon]
MLFYGPPGTGKTMVAKRLARTSGMDYAIMSGGDVGPLGRDAVTQLHAMFDWATTSRRGLLLFIDEADAFLASRSRAQMSEDQRNALNALLFRTGEANNRFMLVLATNRPGDLDRAVSDRVDESIVFDLPDEPARELLIKQYYQKYIVDAGKDVTGPLAWLRRSAAAIKVDDSVTPEYLTALAKRTAGFSGREISKLFISVQGNVYGRQTPTLTRDILEETVQWKLAEHTTKLHFGDSVYDYTALPTSASEAAASSSRSAVVNAGAGAPAAKPKLA